MHRQINGRALQLGRPLPPKGRAAHSRGSAVPGSVALELYCKETRDVARVERMASQVSVRSPQAQTSQPAPAPPTPEPPSPQPPPPPSPAPRAHGQSAGKSAGTGQSTGNGNGYGYNGYSGHAARAEHGKRHGSHGNSHSRGHSTGGSHSHTPHGTSAPVPPPAPPVGRMHSGQARCLGVSSVES